MIIAVIDDSCVAGPTVRPRQPSALLEALGVPQAGGLKTAAAACAAFKTAMAAIAPWPPWRF